MSDEMMVQNKRPSALPYLLGGAALGGTAYWSPVGLTKQKYTSFDDIVKEKEDQFVKDKGKAKGDAVDAYEKVAAEKANYKKVLDNVAEETAEIMGKEENAKWDDKIKAEGVKYDGAVTETKEARKTLVEQIEQAIKDEKIKVDEITSTDAKEAKNANKLKEAAEKYLKDNESKLAKDNAAVDAFKEVKDAANELFGKKETETALKKTLEDKAKAEGVKAEKTITEAGKTALEAAKGKLKAASEDGWKAVEKSVENIKTPNRWLNAGIMAAALGLGALAIRPKAKEDV